MKPIAVFDLETDPFRSGRTPQPFLAGFFDGQTVRSWWGKNCVQDCYKAMRRVPGYFYAHNGGKFDFRYLLPHLDKSSTKIQNIKGRIARIVLESGTEFRDSWLLLPVPLRVVGKKKIEYWKFEKEHREKYKAEIIEYWKQDLYSLYQAVSEFVAEYGFGLTMAGRTFDQLKKRFDLTPPTTNEHYDARFRPFYYGGRVEFFRLGRVPGRYTIIDINSAYPHAMLEKHVFGTQFEVTTKLPKNESVLQRCFIRFIGNSLGGLPWHDPGGTLCFGPHRGEFHATGWEFVEARRMGKIQVDNVVACHRPLDCRDFGRYIHYFFRLKKAAKKGSPEELFAKLFMNSCYGRFALNPREFREVVITEYGEEPDENDTWRKKLRAVIKARHPGVRGESLRELEHDYWQGFEGKWSLANDFEDVGMSIWERPKEITNTSFFNVATAASITGCVRAFLMESIAQARDVIYCDTDSLICGDTGKLKLGPDLGQWKVEGRSTRAGVWIAGKKLYAVKLAPPYKTGQDGEPIRWKTAHKGVKLDPKDICDIALGAIKKTTAEAPTFSLFTSRNALEADFITRTIRRDDQRKKRKAT